MKMQGFSFKYKIVKVTAGMSRSFTTKPFCHTNGKLQNWRHLIPRKISGLGASAGVSESFTNLSFYVDVGRNDAESINFVYYQ